MRIWFGLILKITVWTKSHLLPELCYLQNYNSLRGLAPVVPSCSGCSQGVWPVYLMNTFLKYLDDEKPTFWATSSTGMFWERSRCAISIRNLTRYSFIANPVCFLNKANSCERPYPICLTRSSVSIFLPQLFWRKRIASSIICDFGGAGGLPISPATRYRIVQHNARKSPSSAVEGLVLRTMPTSSFTDPRRVAEI